MTALDIIKEIFGEYTSTFVDETSGSYGTRTYCVQYRETDFNFVSRLMEEEGIFYYWRHTEDKHELVLADAASTHVASPGFAEVLYLRRRRPRRVRGQHAGHHRLADAPRDPDRQGHAVGLQLRDAQHRA